MSNENKDDFKLTITQDKLVDLLMHAATREDIAKSDTKFDKKFENLEIKMEARFDKIDARFEALESKMDARFEKLEAKHDKILWGIVIAILVPIAIQIFPRFIT